jgi:hypothetical protein
VPALRLCRMCKGVGLTRVASARVRDDAPGAPIERQAGMSNRNFYMFEYGSSRSTDACQVQRKGAQRPRALAQRLRLFQPLCPRSIHYSRHALAALAAFAWASCTPFARETRPERAPIDQLVEANPNRG